jgi:hypothetical protein
MQRALRFWMQKKSSTLMVSYKVQTRRQSKKLQIQGAQILKNEAYL